MLFIFKEKFVDHCFSSFLWPLFCLSFNIHLQTFFFTFHWYKMYIIHECVCINAFTNIPVLFYQDDVVMGGLTVRENFQFSASLRLPSHISNQERKDRVENVVNELGLTACADTKVRWNLQVSTDKPIKLTATI